MILTPAQKTIASDSHRFRVVNSGRRFGKTMLAIEEIIGVAISGDDKRIAYIAPTYQQARDICWQELKRRTLTAQKSCNESRLEIIVHTQDGGESLIQLRGWESVETLRGQRFDFLVIDEVASMRNFFINWLEVLLPTLTDTRGSVLFISTPKGFNHFYDLYNREGEDDQFKSFHFTTYDNPYIQQDEIDNLKKSTTPDAFAQEYMADFRKQSGLVYKEFSRVKDTYKELGTTKPMQKFGGVDFGYTNPCAVLDVRYDGEIFYVEGEWYKRYKTESQIAEYVEAMMFESVYPDPESPSAIKELTDRRVNVKEVLKGKDSIQSGIQRVRELLLANRLKVNKRCIHLIEEFESYAYPEKDNEENLPEKPIKANDHALDALRYIISMVDTSKEAIESVHDYWTPNYQPAVRMGEESSNPAI